jgi:hypothetical protein
LLNLGLATAKTSTGVLSNVLTLVKVTELIDARGIVAPTASNIVKPADPVTD